jgi:hypothetical protein
MYIKSFEGWLREQEGRSDPVGDLAADYLRMVSERLPFRQFVRQNDSLTLEVLQSLGACSAAIEAYHLAMEEWKEWKHELSTSEKLQGAGFSTADKRSFYT